MTPHINAAQDSFADTVLFPGDPLRAKYIAENYLENAELVCDVRNMFGYTGTYKGKKISVMGHGMGIPSVSIYAHELINDYNVKKLIRIGSCGGVADDVHVRDIVVATGAGTASSTNRSRFAGYDYAAVPDFNLLKACWETAESNNIEVRFGNIFTNDLFYGSDPCLLPALKRMNILCVEMETAALFAIAAEHRVQALSILTVSDHVVTGDETSAQERETTFNQMMELALETVLKG
ncbi:purine-nucleoside phosphorylase [Shewanella rhizosphaerae]|uniref:purine-nucleoside phosphorylase n=1 Tax=Shewanella rhizosphaerae TaxID=2864207 RepID=UPI001C656A91|nr:purine-nucleoside phosphorylase [Shewanella rhizosphaerae]QYK12408.1 purine-nucleoside phosphorylase [Shewanella rhizosphaerae]